jgi:crotonobetainyl-CoA:carnitine CoA-transferase CaiB-like acyl-CoA transferase
MNLPFRMSGAVVSAARRMSTLGEHGLAYLKEIGLSEDEIAAFAGKEQSPTPSMRSGIPDGRE